jgi:hypothetical protein
MPAPAGTPKANTFIGTADINAATAKLRLVQIIEEIISLLAGDPQATVHVNVEISADFPAPAAQGDSIAQLYAVILVLALKIRLGSKAMSYLGYDDTRFLRKTVVNIDAVIASMSKAC